MRLLDRYLLRELLLPLGYCLGGFLIFWVSFDLINRINDLQKSHLKVSEIVEYYLVTSPELLLIVMPIALLLALLYALTTHARYNELTAMRAAGISLWRIAAPYFAVGIIFSIAYFVINEFWVPTSLDKSEEILHRHDEISVKDDLVRHDLKFLNSRDNRAWWIKSYNLNTAEMHGVVIDWHLQDGTRKVISANSGVYSNGIWRFTEVGYSLAQNITDTPVYTNELEFSDWAETPGLIKSEIKLTNRKQALKNPQLSMQDLLNFLDLHPKLDKATAALVKTRFHERISAPVTCFVVVLIALPFGALSGRRNVYVGVASSISICFAYFIISKLAIALGTGGYFPPWLAAWLPNVLFSGVAIALTMRVR